ncbi:MAG TPA: hypothetical protein PKZ36_00290 [Candidatus Paceibacterota bacterium]|nr:hypothetical protein [Candidatus Paceibacterota bacterium]HPT17841.1 hypothetical protein [Candidatus Paceibacterota bacterium]
MKEQFKKLGFYFKKNKVKSILILIVLLICFIFSWKSALVILIILAGSYFYKTKNNIKTTTETAKKICPHCKEEINKEASRCPHCHGKIYVWTKEKKIVAGILAVIVFMIFSSGLFSGDKTTTTTTQPPAPTISPEELAKWELTPAGKLCEKHTTWKKEDCDRLADERIWIGMTYEMLVYLNGKPDSANPSNYGNGIKYQYCWHDNTPSCYYDTDNDGVIDSYN